MWARVGADGARPDRRARRSSAAAWPCSTPRWRPRPTGRSRCTPDAAIGPAATGSAALMTVRGRFDGAAASGTRRRAPAQPRSRAARSGAARPAAGRAGSCACRPAPGAPALPQPGGDLPRPRRARPARRPRPFLLRVDQDGGPGRRRRCSSTRGSCPRIGAFLLNNVSTPAARDPARRDVLDPGALHAAVHRRAAASSGSAVRRRRAVRGRDGVSGTLQVTTAMPRRRGSGRVVDRCDTGPLTFSAQSEDARAPAGARPAARGARRRRRAGRQRRLRRRGVGGDPARGHRPRHGLAVGRREPVVRADRRRASLECGLPGSTRRRRSRRTARSPSRACAAARRAHAAARRRDRGGGSREAASGPSARACARAAAADGALLDRSRAPVAAALPGGTPPRTAAGRDLPRPAQPDPDVPQPFVLARAMTARGRRRDLHLPADVPALRAVLQQPTPARRSRPTARSRCASASASPTPTRSSASASGRRRFSATRVQGTLRVTSVARSRRTGRVIDRCDTGDVGFGAHV